LKSERLLSRRAFLGTMATLTGGIGGIGYSFFVEPTWLKVESVQVPLPHLPRAFEGLTLVQLSDMHFGPDVDPAHIRQAVTVTLGLRPDVVVLTGDYVSTLSGGEDELIVQELGRLSAPEGVWAVLGNHDHYTDCDIVEAALTRAGIRVLRNANGALHRAGSQLWLAGVDDVSVGEHNLFLALYNIPRQAPVILLAHEPDFADRAAQDPRVGLQLSGHSHGGQVRLPFYGPVDLPRLGRKYPEGLRRIGNLWLYTNRGLGTSVLPVRFNCRPEITLLTLTAAS
jgi:predicted MPP superfamily phosphohydrolase